jgi:hypothetical protein
MGAALVGSLLKFFCAKMISGGGKISVAFLDSTLF